MNHTIDIARHAIQGFPLGHDMRRILRSATAHVSLASTAGPLTPSGGRQAPPNNL